MVSSDRPSSSVADSGPLSKKARIDEDDPTDEVSSFLDSCWQCYRNYLDSCSGNDDAGNIDELQELLHMVETEKPATANDRILPLTLPSLSELSVSSLSTCIENKRDLRSSLFPVLISVAHGILAEEYITQLFSRKRQLELLRQLEEQDGSIDAAQVATTFSLSVSQEDLVREETVIRHHLTQSLVAFPHNVQVWSVAANLIRMQLFPRNSKTGTIQNQLPLVAAAYQRAAESAVLVRQTALNILAMDIDTDDDKPPDNDDEDDYNNATSNVKEWVELLLLNQVLGVEWTGDDDDEDDANDEEKDEDNDQVNHHGKEMDKKSPLVQASKSNQDDAHWSSSAVEETCRFMAAMMYSTINQHDLAREQIMKFPMITHRLHPNVWKGVDSASTTEEPIVNNNPPDNYLLLSNPEEPVLFTGPQDCQEGVLPPLLYERLCQAFAPNAVYWNQSDYTHRGYYSYFMNVPDKIDHKPSNLLEDILFQHLLPCAQRKLAAQQKQQQGDTSTETIVGAEWWVHTRPIQANLGHNLHFDTDEALLSQEDKEVTHPILSSVLYLTGGGGNCAGPTIVLNQTPFSKENATHAWRNSPVDNTYLLFPGHLLHGVLPCPGTAAVESEQKHPMPSTIELTDLLGPSCTVNHDDGATNQDALPPPPSQQKHRLTFMVGWWTRRVPDRMKERKLYGPCGPLPPPTDEHSWVRSLMEGYDSTNATTVASPSSSRHDTNNLKVQAIPKVAPAWEVLRVKSEVDPIYKNEPVWNIPPRIDHRFFVTDTPQCFYDSMFESDVFVEPSDDEEEEDDNEDGEDGEGDAEEHDNEKEEHDEEEEEEEEEDVE